MRDGVQLVADHYAPLTSPARPAPCWSADPMGAGFRSALIFARLYAARGYHVVLQSVRGTFGSGGEFEPMVNEAADGADTVGVAASSNPGSPAGSPPSGCRTWDSPSGRCCHDPPPELAAAVITAGPHDMSASVWGTGSFAVDDFLGWSDLVAHQEDSKLRSTIRQAAGPPHGGARGGRVAVGRRRPGAAGRGRAVVRILGRARRPRRSVLGSVALPRRAGPGAVPVLLLGGWQDIFLRPDVAAVPAPARPRRRRRPDHRARGRTPSCSPRGWPPASGETLDWLGTHLGGAPARRPSAVNVFVNGQGWRNLPDWPPATTDHLLYLRPGGRLGETAPEPGAAPATFRYDPADPTPTTGGPLLSPNGGYADDSQLAQRATCSTSPAPPCPTICTSTATRSSSSRTRRTIPTSTCSSGSVRSTPTAAPAMSATATGGLGGPGRKPSASSSTASPTASRAGSRIRVLIAGSWFPRYARNLGTGEPVLTGAAAEAGHAFRAFRTLPAGAARREHGPSADSIADPGRDLG